MEVPRLGVRSELLVPAYTIATVMPDLSHVCNLHHSSRQRKILSPLSEARDRTRKLMVPKVDLLTTEPRRELLFVFYIVLPELIKEF